MKELLQLIGNGKMPNDTQMTFAHTPMGLLVTIPVLRGKVVEDARFFLESEQADTLKRWLNESVEDCQHECAMDV